MSLNNEIVNILDSQLEQKGYSNYNINEIEICEPAIDGNGNPFYEKQRLLYIFSRRLKGCILNDKQNPMIDFLKESIEILKNVPNDEIIFSWSITVNDERISGRSTKDKILHIYPSKFNGSINN